MVSTVSEQIAVQAEIHPFSTALRSGERLLTYQELNHRADQFAKYVKEQYAVAPGDALAICMERSFDWIIAALGVLRAGATFVPLDTAWPDARLRFAVQDSEAVALIARTAILERLTLEMPGIDPCRDSAAVAGSHGTLDREIPLATVAYVVYTSGSSGTPKGVEITHANLAHLAAWHQAAFNVTTNDRASHLAGLGFDAAMWEIWPNLVAGATVCLADDVVRASPELIEKWMLEQAITVGFVPTVHALPMISMKWPNSTPLRCLLTGGEALRSGPQKQLPFDVFNNYGPAECTVVSTSSKLQTGLPDVPPIGRPIKGAHVYLLDENGGEVAEGTLGEIYIGGDGVGRGYRNRPGLTKERFLADPFVGDPRARMYRTGDRGVRLANGEIEFRGRLDRQTKIRGQRVELDEIDSVLSRHPSINFGVSVNKATEAGENQLTAYVLLKEIEPVPSGKDIQEHLLKHLPDYMVPSSFVRLRGLPLSANGKLDLTLIEGQSELLPLTTQPVEAPGTLVEEKLLTIMQALLGKEQIGVNDNFFLAGGHSLLGMQVVMRLRSAFGVDISLQQLFESPTVKRLALVVEDRLIEAIDTMSDEEAEIQFKEENRDGGLEREHSYRCER